MKTIAVINQKGGVGKTTTCIQLASILADDYGKRILLIDADSQCNATEFFGADPALGNLAEVLRCEDNEGMFAMICIQETEHKGISMLAGDESLMDLDLTKVSLQGVRPYVLRDLKALLTESNAFDYCIVDCPPAFNAASTAALIAADDVIIPIKLDAFSLRGMTNLLRQLGNMRKINPGIRLAGCLSTMWYRSAVMDDAEAQLRAGGIPVFRQVIRRSDKVDETTFYREPLHAHSPHSGAGVDYRRFVSEYLRGGKHHGS